MTDQSRPVAFTMAVSKETAEQWAKEGEIARDLQRQVLRQMTDGYTIAGPTEPVPHWVPPEIPKGASPEWLALWNIATEKPTDDCYECGGDAWAVELAREAIGGGTDWTPGRKPGRVPGMFEEFAP